MVTKQVTSVWTMGGWQPPVGQSFQGFQHQAEDLPNQDAYCIEQYDVTNSTLCVLADGSGGPEAIRSDAGSKIAVQTFRKVIEDEIFPLLRKDTLDPAALEETWNLVGKKIEKTWIEECLNHLRENPFSEEENLFRLETDELVERPICAYTTTLSGALLTQKFGLFLHLGDAEVMLTEGAGQTESISQPATEANQTAITLGSIHRLPFHPRVISGPEWQSKELVFLATDGVREAFPDRDELSQHVSGYLNAWRNKGSHRKLSIMTRDHCHRFASESGSGGDATLLIVKRVQKEDVLSRGEFEKAWLDFERQRLNLLAEVSQNGNDLKKELQAVSTRLRDSAQSREADLRKTTENLSRKIESIGNDHHQKVDQLGRSILQHFNGYATDLALLKKKQNYTVAALVISFMILAFLTFAPGESREISEKLGVLDKSMGTRVNELQKKVDSSEKEFSALQDKVDSSDQNLSKLQDKVNSSGKEFNALLDQVTLSFETSTKFSETVLKEEIEKLTTELVELQRKVVSLESSASVKEKEDAENDKATGEPGKKNVQPEVPKKSSKKQVDLDKQTTLKSYE